MQELRWAVNQRKRSGTSSLAMTPPVGQPVHTLLKASKYFRKESISGSGDKASNLFLLIS